MIHRMRSAIRWSMLTLFCLSHAVLAQESDPCVPAAPTADDATVIAWYAHARHGGFGPLRAIAVARNGVLEQAADAELKLGQTMWNVLDERSVVTLTAVRSLTYNYRAGITWCLFSADTDRDDLAPGTVFTSDPSFRLRAPTAAEQAAFDTNIYPDTYCANHGGMFLRDVPPEEIPPCEEPELIGVSDLNEDGRPELWGTEILKFATQFAVWDSARGYARMFAACPGCGD